MRKLREFVKSTLVGGLLVLLPLGILAYAAMWLFGLIRKAISPVAKIVADEYPALNNATGLAADFIAIALLIGLCFVIGVLIRTRMGTWLHSLVELRLFRRIPGYTMVRETVHQFLGKKQSPFSAVALAQVFGNDTLVSAFITDTHDDGSYTVFVPTGPNPTSGNIYHLKAENVFPVTVSVEDAMRSIISCGAGSSVLLAKLREGQSAPRNQKPDGSEAAS